MSRIMNVGLRPLRVGKFSTLVRPKNLLLLGGLFLFAVGILIFGLMQGSFSVPASEVGRALFAPENVSTDARYIVQDIRLPRVIMALLCGAMLGMAGAAMQSIARNGLADPGLIGVKEGCSVAVLWLIFQFPMLGVFWRPVAGLAGGLLVALIVIFCARDISRPRFVLIGIGVSWFFAASIVIHVPRGDEKGKTPLHGTVLLCLEMIVWSVASAVPQRAVKTIKRINDFHRGLKTGRKNG